jgi:hypothetical protein
MIAEFVSAYQESSIKEKVPNEVNLNVQCQLHSLLVELAQTCNLSKITRIPISSLCCRDQQLHPFEQQLFAAFHGNWWLQMLLPIET